MAKQDGGQIIALTSVGIGLNMAHAVRHGKDPFPVFVVGGVYMLLLAGMADVMDSRLAVAFAALYALGTVVVRFDTVTAITNGITGTPNTPRKGK